MSAALLQTIDFEMLDVVRETGSGVIFAKLRNNGSGAYNGPLTFLVLFGNDRLDPITVPVNLAAGATPRRT
ncbi:MAG: hypothetical protein MZV49_13700 [Rhodopseudomonas palustris]|nr:hypothetical protein [Rhodopseudomonas palustris]